MRNLLARFWNDEAGFIISSELVLVGTIAVLSLVVGLAELSHAVNSEIRDCADAFCSINQSERYDSDRDNRRGGYRGAEGGGYGSNSSGDGSADFVGWAASGD